MGLRNRIARALGYEPARALKASPAQAEILRACRPFSMASEARILAVADAADYAVRAGIPGDFVECGVYRGGCAMAAAYAFLNAGTSDRTLHLFDTFEGMPHAGPEDVRTTDGLAAETLYRENWCLAGLDEVSANMTSTGYPAERVKLVKGLVEETLPAQAPAAIAVLRLDTDWYASTRHEMEHLFPRLSRGGVLIVDDYGHWAGAQKAVDEYFDAQGVAMLLARTDDTGRMGIKL